MNRYLTTPFPLRHTWTHGFAPASYNKGGQGGGAQNGPLAPFDFQPNIAVTSVKLSNKDSKTWQPWPPCGLAPPSAFIRVHQRFLARGLASGVPIADVPPLHPRSSAFICGSHSLEAAKLKAGLADGVEQRLGRALPLIIADDRRAEPHVGVVDAGQGRKCVVNFCYAGFAVHAVDGHFELGHGDDDSRASALSKTVAAAGLGRLNFRARCRYSGTLRRPRAGRRRAVVGMKRLFWITRGA